MALAVFVKLLFLLAVGSSLFLMVVWAGVTVYRVLYPERSVPVLGDWISEGDGGDPVGVQQIQQDRSAAAGEEIPEYHYRVEDDSWWSAGSREIPEEWTDDLWRRRN